MKNLLKLFYSITFTSIFMNVISQSDSGLLNKKNKSIYISASAGIPIFNQFIFSDFNEKNIYKSYSDKKIIYNLNFDISRKHFTYSFFSNFIQNDFIGSLYLFRKFSSRSPYEYNEVYQKVKYNYLQFGGGLGYNYNCKKNNFCITINAAYNVYSKFYISTYYTQNLTYNNKDTSGVLYKNIEVDILDKYYNINLNLRLSYSYLFNKNLAFFTTINSAYNFLRLNMYETGANVSSSYLAYRIYGQKIIYPTLGLKYKLK